MSLRRMLLGLVCFAVAGPGVTAQPPPRSALSEGREVDPVARDFPAVAPPMAVESGTPALPAEKPGDGFGWRLVVAVHDAIMDHFTIPLGTVPMDDAR